MRWSPTTTGLTTQAAEDQSAARLLGPRPPGHQSAEGDLMWEEARSISRAFPDCATATPLPCDTDTSILVFLILVVIGVLTGGLELQPVRRWGRPGERVAGAVQAVRAAWNVRRRRWGPSELEDIRPAA